MKRLSKWLDRVREIYKGFVNNTSGGCCGISLPKKEQAQLKDFKDGKTASSGNPHSEETV